jgi:hypothetical protein
MDWREGGLHSLPVRLLKMMYTGEIVIQYPVNNQDT